VLVLAFAVLVVALAAAFAVPQSRSSILRFFHIRGATVERVRTLPPAEVRPLATGLGPLVPIATAESRAGFHVLLPAEAKGLDHLYAGNGYAATILHVHGKPVLLLEFLGQDFGVVKKAAQPGTQIKPTIVNGRDAIWIAGAPHVVTYTDHYGRYGALVTRFSGNALLWTRGNLTLRLEGKLTMGDALSLARTVR
jgi:hypothetical protein